MTLSFCYKYNNIKKLIALTTCIFVLFASSSCKNTNEIQSQNYTIKPTVSPILSYEDIESSTQFLKSRLLVYNIEDLFIYENDGVLDISIYQNDSGSTNYVMLCCAAVEAVKDIIADYDISLGTLRIGTVPKSKNFRNWETSDLEKGIFVSDNDIKQNATLEDIKNIYK